MEVNMRGQDDHQFKERQQDNLREQEQRQPIPESSEQQYRSEDCHESKKNNEQTEPGVRSDERLDPGEIRLPDVPGQSESDLRRRVERRPGWLLGQQPGQIGDQQNNLRADPKGRPLPVPSP